MVISMLSDSGDPGLAVELPVAAVEAPVAVLEDVSQNFLIMGGN